MLNEKTAENCVLLAAVIGLVAVIIAGQAITIGARLTVSATAATGQAQFRSQWTIVSNGIKDGLDNQSEIRQRMYEQQWIKTKDKVQQKVAKKSSQRIWTIIDQWWSEKVMVMKAAMVPWQSERTIFQTRTHAHIMIMAITVRMTMKLPNQARIFFLLLTFVNGSVQSQRGYR